MSLWIEVKRFLSLFSVKSHTAGIPKILLSKKGECFET
ncbi:hypothetical protein KIS4809_1377 [Bacillus sp. ZZV12-4809]|nr:hypothetical protein KIS4809_1377 [Bacillus sp. ZZV12-4809]